VIKSLLVLINPSKALGGIWLKENIGSSWGKPATGEASSCRMFSPTSPFQRESSIMTESELILPEELVNTFLDFFFDFSESEFLQPIHKNSISVLNNSVYRIKQILKL